MPVISSKALASVFDSYSCVVIVSETTEISLTPLACSFLAASMNHFISAICWSLDRLDGWNSLSTHFLASGSPAQAWLATARAAAVASAVYFIFIVFSLIWWIGVVVGNEKRKGVSRAAGSARARPWTARS